MAMTLILNGSNGSSEYVTAIFSTEDDIKVKKNTLKWFKEELHYEKPTSLWEAKIFKVCSSPEESLKATLLSVKDGLNSDSCISFSEALLRKDVVKMVDFRKDRIP